jgi:hypothetical protein
MPDRDPGDTESAKNAGHGWVFGVAIVSVMMVKVG